MGKNIFFDLLESGHVKITDEGLLTILGEYALFFPARVLLHLQEVLISKFDKEGKKIIYGIGYYQTSEALKRYIKVLGIQKLDKSKIFELSMRLMAMIGNGNFTIERCNLSTGTASISNPKLPVAHAYSLTEGQSKEPIDYYVSGLLAGILGPISGKKVGCLETKCLAKGDKVCHFELSPKIKLKF